MKSLTGQADTHGPGVAFSYAAAGKHKLRIPIARNRLEEKGQKVKG
jgi:hypothetical protein